MLHNHVILLSGKFIEVLLVKSQHKDLHDDEVVELAFILPRNTEILKKPSMLRFSNACRPDFATFAVIANSYPGSSHVVRCGVEMAV